LIASYIVRRGLCGLTAKNYNKTFLRIAKHLRENGVSRAEFAASFAGSNGDAVRFPTDQETRDAIRDREQYDRMSTPALRHVICELEMESRTKFDISGAIPDDLTIEHVLPDKWAEWWELPDGTKAPHDYAVAVGDPRHGPIQDRQRLKNTLGNLALLTGAGNTRARNYGFVQTDPLSSVDKDAVRISKREILQKSLLKTNLEMGEYEEWSEKQIRARAGILADRALHRWPYPVSP